MFRQFCKMFSESSQSVELYCSCLAGPATKADFQKTHYKTFRTSGRPTQYRGVMIPTLEQEPEPESDFQIFKDLESGFGSSKKWNHS